MILLDYERNKTTTEYVKHTLMRVLFNGMRCLSRLSRVITIVCIQLQYLHSQYV
jgi:hypothetical protein